MAGAAAAGMTAVVSVVFTWWSVAFDELGNRVGTANFGQRGIAPVAHAVFALALGTLAGAVMKKTLSAMATTLLGFLVVRFTFQHLVRPRMMATVTATIPDNALGPAEDHFAGMGGWILSSQPIGDGNRVVKMHPADHFWPLQIRESISFLVLAALLAAAALWWTRHRTA